MGETIMKRSEVRNGGHAINGHAMKAACLGLLVALGCLLAAATVEADMPAHLQVGNALWDDSDAGGKEVQGHASLRIGTGTLRQCDRKSEVLAIRFNRRTAPLINQVQGGQPLNLDQQVKAAVTDGLRKTVCDAKGDFRFEGMGTGFWYVWTQLPLTGNAKMQDTTGPGDRRTVMGETVIGALPIDTSSSMKTATGVLATFVVVSPETTNDIDLSADVVKLWPTWTETR